MTAHNAEIRQCYICVVKAEMLGLDHPLFSELCRGVCARGHTEPLLHSEKHLDSLANDSSSVCSLQGDAGPQKNTYRFIVIGFTG